MPGLPETMYCSQQIHISPLLPQILRQYAKAAIRTQPTDLLRWSTAYFRALSLNEIPPEKKRLEYPEPQNYKGLTPGLMKVLLNQIGKSPDIQISFPDLLYKWEGICMPQEELVKILLSAEIQNGVTMPWYKIIAVAAGFLTDNLTQTMVLICNLLTEEPDGGSAMIPVDVFLLYYKFLAALDLSKTKYVLNVVFYVSPDSKMEAQQGQGSKTIDHAVYGDGSDHKSIMSAVPPEFEHLANEPQGGKDNVASFISEGFSIASDFNQSKPKSQESALRQMQSKKPSHDTSDSSEQSALVGEQDFAQSKLASETVSFANTDLSLEVTNIAPGDEIDMQETSLDTMQVDPLTESAQDDSKSSESKKDSEDIASKSETSKSEEFTPALSIKYDDSLFAPGQDLMVGVRPSEPKSKPDFLGILSTFSQPISMTSDMLGRASPHFHLNKYLASTTPSILTEMESRFTTTNLTSDTNTIFMEELHRPPAAKLVTKSPSEQVRYEINAVKGIGPPVDEETMATFIKYIEERAAFQHGMIMPRNITNFQCPPMENFKYVKEKLKDHTVDIPFEGCKNVY